MQIQHVSSSSQQSRGAAVRSVLEVCMSVMFDVRRVQTLHSREILDAGLRAWLGPSRFEGRSVRTYVASTWLMDDLPVDICKGRGRCVQACCKGKRFKMR